MSRSYTFAGASTTLNAKLTPTQKRCLKSTWQHMSQNGGAQIMERIFQKLINCRPKVKDVFYKAAFVQIFSRYGAHQGRDSITTIHDHGKIMAKVVEDIVSNIPNSPALMREVMEMGRKHAFLKKSGLRAEVWESFGEAALEIIAGQDCVKSNVDAVRAWTILVACLIDELRFGFEQECREQDKRRLSARRSARNAAAAASNAQAIPAPTTAAGASNPMAQSLNASRGQRLAPAVAAAAAGGAGQRRARSEEVASFIPPPSPPRPLVSSLVVADSLVPEEPLFRTTPAHSPVLSRGSPLLSTPAHSPVAKAVASRPFEIQSRTEAAKRVSPRQSSVTVQSRESSLSCATSQIRLSSPAVSATKKSSKANQASANRLP